MTTRRNFLRGVGTALGLTSAGAVAPRQTQGADAATGPLKLVRYPYVQAVGGDRATILWTTRGRGQGVVEYLTRHTFPSAVTASTREFLPSETGLLLPFYQHQVELTGLHPGAEYFYRIKVNGQDLTPRDKLRFRTAGPGPFSFLVFGDSGMGTSAQLRLAQLKGQDRPALVLHTGDIGYWNGTFADFQHRYFEYYRNIMKRVPFFPCPGNHEYETRDAVPYLAVHALPGDDVPASERGRYYSFDWGNVHFISLDTNLALANAVNGTGGMLEWLENDLQKTQQFWRVVYFHHPPYATGPNENDPIMTRVRDYIVPILERHEVELVFNGHEHSYQRSESIQRGALVEPGKGTVYITTGGGGAPLYPVGRRSRIAYGESAHHYVRAEVQGSRMTLRAIRADKQEIDSHTMEPPPKIHGNAGLAGNSLSAALSPAGLVSIWGRNLAAEETQAPTWPLPSDLAGTTVTLNGRPLSLLYVSPTEIDAQVVSDLDLNGSATLRVTTPNGTTETSVVIH